MGTTPLIMRLFCNGMRISRAASTRAFCAGREDLNAKYNKCQVGDKAVAVRNITNDDVIKFAQLSGDTNPIHLPPDGKMAVVHGAFLNAIVSCVIGTQLPGAGTVVAWQSLHFPHKCYADEEVKVQVEVVNVRKIINLKFECVVGKCVASGKQKCVLHGEAKVVQR